MSQFYFEVIKEYSSGNDCVRAIQLSLLSEQEARANAIKMLKTYKLTKGNGYVKVYSTNGSADNYLGDVSAYHGKFVWLTYAYLNKGYLKGKQIDTKGRIGNPA